MTLTRRILIHKLMSKGLTRKESKDLISATLSVMVDSLKDHNSIDLEFGTLEVRLSPPKFRFFTKGLLVERFSSPYRVVFKPRRDHGHFVHLAARRNERLPFRQ